MCHFHSLSESESCSEGVLGLTFKKTFLFFVCSLGVPGEIRTHDPQIRNLVKTPCKIKIPFNTLVFTPTNYLN